MREGFAKHRRRNVEASSCDTWRDFMGASCCALGLHMKLLQSPGQGGLLAPVVLKWTIMDLHGCLDDV